jgi:hypothetical protein
MRRAQCFLFYGFSALTLLACGESRRPIGDECLRDEDCLSGVCSARSCVSAPPLKTGATGPTPDEEPDIAEGDGGLVTPPTDAGGEGG